MSEESPPYRAARALNSAVAAEKWTLDLLRGLADAIVATPRAQKADAMRLLTPSLTEVDRVAKLVGLRPTT